ncbi:MAG: hypothetical protein IRZ33_05960 [Alicyclobacillaceae bacterium]|nr:hypothetical protein [Alicyclobacillaceae bacterium]
MQGPNGNPKHPRRKPQSAQPKGRVIDMRAWKLKKRMEQMRRSKPRTRTALGVLAAAIAAATILFTIGSCVPFWGQARCIVVTWFLAVIGGAIGLCLYVLKHRWAMRLLSLYVVCMALSFVAAVVKVLTTPG